MNVLRRSRAEDAVDRYNHTWSVLLMLLLFLVTWLSSLSPDLQPSVAVPMSSSQNTHALDKYQAHCWCPPEFNSMEVSYVNSVCAGALNAAIRQESNMSYAKLWEFPDDVPIPAQKNASMLLNITTEGSKDATNAFSKKMEGEAKDLNKDISYFVYMKTPIVLFLFAVLLKLPHVVWILLSSCCGLNVDSTLETAVRGQTLDQDSRKKLNKELARAVSDDVKKTKVVTSCLYLLLKVLMVAVVIGELVVIQDTIQEYHKLKDEHESFKNEIDTAVTISKPPVRDISTSGIYCEFSLRMMQNIQMWIVPCAFSKTETTSDSISSPSQAKTSMNILDLVGTVHGVVGIYLLVLVIINVLNLASWLARLLVGPCRVSVGSSSELPLDGQLLLHMARLNTGPLIVQDMVEGGLGGGGSTRGGTEMEKLHE